MVARAFPIVKLAYLALRQISRPIANHMKRSAKSSPVFRQYVCIPPAQVYHWLEVNFRLNLMGFGKPKHVTKLTEGMAIDLGAEMLGEFIIFAVTAGTIIEEYHRTARKTAMKEERAQQEMASLHEKVENLTSMTRSQEAEMRELQQTVASLHQRNQDLLTALIRRQEPTQCTSCEQ